MTHGRLRRAERDAGAAEVRAKSVPQRVDVDGAPALVGLEDDFLAVALLDPRDPSEGQIAIEDADQAVRDREDLGGGRQPRWDRLFAFACLGLRDVQLFVEPRAEFGGEILSQWDL